jgi:hypothetical protein
MVRAHGEWAELPHNPNRTPTTRGRLIPIRSSRCLVTMTSTRKSCFVLGTMVERRLRHKNTLAVTIGPDLRLPVARERLVRRA